MARSINEIYKEIVAEKDKRLELSEYKSDSKVSVINGIAWFVSAAIYSFETIMDTFIRMTDWDLGMKRQTRQKESSRKHLTKRVAILRALTRSSS